MTALIPFERVNSPLRISSEVTSVKSGLLLQFELSNFKGVKGLHDWTSSRAVQLQGRQDDLWKTTCFELFVANGEAKSYWEFNFSPLGFWNSYMFTDYRQGMREHDQFKLQSAKWVQAASELGRFELLLAMPEHNISKLQLGATAVIEDLQAEKTYWSLGHEGNKPDFHLRSQWTMKVD